MPRTKGLKDYSSELKEKVRKERKAGFSLRQIAKKYNISVYSVGAWCGETLTSADFEIDPAARYVRVSIRDEKGNWADTRGFFPDEIKE